MSRGKLRNPENFSPEGQQLFERLVRLRKSLGVDQAGLARALRVSQALVWKWEADKGFPSGDGYAKLAQLAEDSDDRTYFMELALQEGAYLARVVKMMDTEEQRQFCMLMGVNLAAIDRSGRDGVNRRKVVNKRKTSAGVEAKRHRLVRKNEKR